MTFALLGSCPCSPDKSAIGAIYSHRYKGIAIMVPPIFASHIAIVHIKCVCCVAVESIFLNTANSILAYRAEAGVGEQIDQLRAEGLLDD